MMAEDNGVPLAERMKSYEMAPTLPERAYVIIRVDGRAFHTFLRDAEQPFDFEFMRSMDSAARALCREVAGAQFAYVQSDEISVLATNVHRARAELWFGGVIPKIVSVSASVATEAFNNNLTRLGQPRIAHFDARVITLPDRAEVANYFLWRQQDWRRNAVSMAARAHFPHSALVGRNTVEVKKMLTEVGEDFDAAWPEHVRLGRICVRQLVERELDIVHQRTGKTVTAHALRSHWSVEAAPVFSASADGWVASMIPPSFYGGDL
jgi:tRNA(His) 5'-end guanylyltransferase